MAIYYYSIEPGTPRVYHDDPDCPKGKLIPAHLRRHGEGVDRTLCEECAKLAQQEVRPQPS